MCAFLGLSAWERTELSLSLWELSPTSLRRRRPLLGRLAREHGSVIGGASSLAWSHYRASESPCPLRHEMQGDGSFAFGFGAGRHALGPVPAWTTGSSFSPGGGRSLRTPRGLPRRRAPPLLGGAPRSVRRGQSIWHLRLGRLTGEEEERRARKLARCGRLWRAPPPPGRACPPDGVAWAGIFPPVFDAPACWKHPGKPLPVAESAVIDSAAWRSSFLGPF